MSAQQRRAPRDPARHPAWCSQGVHCDPPRVCVDGTREEAHATYSAVVPIRDNVCDVFLVRIDSVLPGGEHDVCQAIVLTGSGSLSAEQAVTLGRALLAAGEQLAAGLPGTPGGVAAPPTAPGAVA